MRFLVDFLKRKSFNDRMSRWSTSQKEGYAIYYANTSGEYLLHDRRFLFRQTMQILDFSMRSRVTKSSDGCLLCKVSILISNIVKAKTAT